MDSGHRFTFRERLSYRFDNLVGRGTAGMVIVLFASALVFLLIAALVISALEIRDTAESDLSFWEALWQSMLRAIDPGTIGEDSAWPFRFISLAITIMGIFVVSALIGILASGLDARLASLQRGRRRIAVSDHTLVLGWSPKVPTILEQLATARANRDGGTVVLLADRDKVWMDETIATRLPRKSLRGVKIVTRSGKPNEPGDLRLVNPDLATSIIVVSDDTSGREAGVIKTVLCLLNEVELPEQTAVVAEVPSPARAQALRAVVSDQVAVVEPGEMVARTAAQTSREVGLNLVLQELFDFGGCDIYFAEVPQARGVRFGDLLNCFENTCVIGLLVQGKTLINPPPDTVVGQSDQLIVISTDARSVVWTGPVEATPSTPLWSGHIREKVPEKAVMFGWNDSGRAIVGQLDQYVAPGSQLLVVVDPRLVEASAVRLPDVLHNVEVTVREVPDDEDPVGSTLRVMPCDHVLILCYVGESLSPENAESRVLTTFLEARHVLDQLGGEANITAELLDERDVDVIPSATAGEFMVSEKLVSLIMAQLSENIGLQPVFEELLDAEGSEVYCKPIERYATPGVPIRFADVVESAKAQGEIAFGWRVASQYRDRDRGFGVVVNPPKSAAITFEPGDQLVVIAEDGS